MSFFSYTYLGDYLYEKKYLIISIILIINFFYS